MTGKEMICNHHDVSTDNSINYKCTCGQTFTRVPYSDVTEDDIIDQKVKILGYPDNNNGMDIICLRKEY